MIKMGDLSYNNSLPLGSFLDNSLSNITKEIHQNLNNTNIEMDSNTTMGIFNPFTTGDGPEAILVPIAFGIIFLIGIIGNGTLIFTVLFNKVMRNVPNVFIVSLSIGDLLLILVSVPFSATIFTFKGWPYGDFTCRLNYFLETLSLGVSVFTLTALSIDRYMVIVNPMSKHTSKTMAKTVIIAVFIWCLAAILAIPDAVVSHVEDIPLMNISKTLPICFNYPTDVLDYEKYNVCIKFMIYFAIPLVVIAVFYILMARVLIKSGEMMPCEGRGANNHQRQIAARKKVAKVVMSFVLIFAVCWLPRYIYLMWYYFDDSHFNHFWIAFKIIGFCLTFINSCVNPFALYFLSGQFRKYYNRYLFRCIPKVRYTSLEPSSTMHNFNSTVRRASSTTTTIVQSQSMC